MHEMQTALAEADAKIEVLQKYEISQEVESIIGTDEEEKIKKDSILLQQLHSAVPAPVVDQAVQHMDPLSSSYTLTTNLNNGPVLDSLCMAVSQQATVTEYLVKNNKASLLPDLTIPTFKGDPLEYKSFVRAIEHGIEGRTDNNTVIIH